MTWKCEVDRGIYREDGTPVFETGCGCCTDSGLSMRDGVLMAAAPDLLAALKAVVAVADRNTNEFNAAKAAIAKAESADDGEEKTA